MLIFLIQELKSKEEIMSIETYGKAYFTKTDCPIIHLTDLFYDYNSPRYYKFDLPSNGQDWKFKPAVVSTLLQMPTYVKKFESKINCGICTIL